MNPIKTFLMVILTLGLVLFVLAAVFGVGTPGRVLLYLGAVFAVLSFVAACIEAGIHDLLNGQNK